MPDFYITFKNGVKEQYHAAAQATIDQMLADFLAQSAVPASIRKQYANIAIGGEKPGVTPIRPIVIDLSEVTIITQAEHSTP